MAEEDGVFIRLMLPWREEECDSVVFLLLLRPNGRRRVTLITPVEATEHARLVSSLEGHGAVGEAFGGQLSDDNSAGEPHSKNK